MSAIPLDGIEDIGAESNGFIGSTWTPNDNLPPAPGSAPLAARFQSPSGPEPSFGPPMMAMAPRMPTRPNAVDARHSVAAPHYPQAFGVDPSAAEPQRPPERIPQDNAHTLGLGLLLVGVGSAIGAKYGGGMFGGLSGGLYGGSIMNLARAARAVTIGTPEADREAVVSGTYAVLGGALASYLLYRGLHDKGGKKKDYPA
jgi:hypothetical protein